MILFDITIIAFGQKKKKMKGNLGADEVPMRVSMLKNCFDSSSVTRWLDYYSTFGHSHQ